MYPDKFDYHLANSIDHALELIDGNPDAELLAGGHSLLPMMKTGLAQPEALIDLNGIESMHGISRTDGAIHIGALTNYATVAGSEIIRDVVPVVGDAAHEIGDIQVRNRGTVGGNIAHADPASDLPAAILTTNATIVAHGPSGEREIPIDDFFHGMYATELAEDELLTRIELPVDSRIGAYAKKPSPSSGYALIGVAVNLTLDDGSITTADVAANGVIDHATRLGPVEEALEGERLSPDVIDTAAQTADAEIDEFLVMEDQQASSEFRTQLLRVYTKRALERVAEREPASRS